MKKYGIQLIAVTAVMASLVGCGKGRHHDKTGYRMSMCGHDKTCSNEDITDFVGDARVSPEKKLEAIAFQLDQITTETMHGCLEGRTAPHILNNGLFLTADLLVWKAYEDGLGFAIRSETNTEIAYTKLHEEELHSKWEPGFRIGIGYNMADHDNWDVRANYTYYEGKAHKDLCECVDEAPVTFYPQWFPALLGGIATGADAHWRVNYDVLDIELGRHYFVSEALSIRPHIGGRGAWINQKYSVDYEDGHFLTLDPVSTFATPTSFDAKNDFGGGGVRAGAQMLWHFTPHFGLSGEISASVLYGRFNIDETVIGGDVSTFFDGVPALTKVKYKIDENYKRIRSNIDAALGLQWEKHFKCSGTNLSVGAFYELSQWYKQNELVQFTETVNSSPVLPPDETAIHNDTAILADERGGDLGFQGFSLRVRFDF